MRSGSESYLKQYARLFNCVEINTSFYRHHQPKTYARWAEAVPDSFRFSVKVPKLVTHGAGHASETLIRFLSEVEGLGRKLSVLLFQFPPGKVFNRGHSEKLFEQTRSKFAGTIVCEPRHCSWFEEEASDLLARHFASYVAADPKLCSRAPSVIPPASPYIRLHGAPRVYYSEYPEAFLTDLRTTIVAHQNGGHWIIFDNTAVGHGYRNALTLTAKRFSIKE